MKKNLLQLMILCYTGISFGQQNAQPQDLRIHINKLTGFANTPNNNWQSSAQDYINKWSYYFKKDHEEARFYAANNAQYIGFTITSAGFKASPVRYSNQPVLSDCWEQELTFKEVSKGKSRLFPG